MWMVLFELRPPTMPTRVSLVQWDTGRIGWLLVARMTVCN